MSRQDLHVTVQSCCERTFVSRYCLYVMTGPSCHDTSIVLRQDLHVTIQSLYDKTFVPQHLPYVATRPPCRDRSAGPGQQRRRGDSNPVPQGVPPPAPFAFFLAVSLWPEGEKQNLRQRRSLRKRKPGPGGRKGGFGGRLGAIWAPPGILGSPPQDPTPFLLCFYPIWGCGGAGVKPGGPHAPLWDTVW